MGEKWVQHRRMVTPGFHYDILKSYLKLTSESAHVMLVRLGSSELDTYYFQVDTSGMFALRCAVSAC